ncbi:hypothetical protein BHE74_00031758 [Ensete ventricosum]|nr:hypothetical protein BHE74_00031758 [Ensete ventricosum]
MGYNIQYPSGVVCIVNAMPTFSQTPKSVNPFDLTSDPAPVVWNQGTVAPGSNGATFSTSGIHQNPAVRYSQLSTPNSFGPVGGNPFG